MTAEIFPAKSHVTAFRVVVTVEIFTTVGCIVDKVPVEQVGLTPLVVYLNSLKLISVVAFCEILVVNAVLNELSATEI